MLGGMCARAAVSIVLFWLLVVYLFLNPIWNLLDFDWSFQVYGVMFLELLGLDAIPANYALPNLDRKYVLPRE